MNKKQKEEFKIINGNSLDVLDTLEDNSIDAIITDPPYELGFMGKKWDKSGIAYNVELWKKALRVLKCGGYLLAFGGTRTYHRIACAIEDAGFEIRDCIMWLYGSGFPKSHNIGLDIDKLNGVESEVIGTTNAPDLQDIGLKQKALGNGHIQSFGQIENAERIQYEIKKARNKWDGWGTALKPAYEPILVARKPIEDTVAKNVLKYGVGGINIDECRIKLEENYKAPKRSIESQNYANSRKGQTQCDLGNKGENAGANELGRFPANVITDGSDEVAKDMPMGATTGHRSEESIKNCIESRKLKKGNSQCDIGGNIDHITEYTDKGSAMRYFYQAKITDKDDENIKGRFPANVITDGSKEVAENMPTTKGSNPKELGDYGFCFDEGKRSDKPISHGYDDEGSAMRYFHTAKISDKDDDVERGRFPSNVIHDGSEEATKDMPITSGSSGKGFKATDYEEHDTATNFVRGDFIPYNDEGSASRYFYSAKASKKDRDDGLALLESKTAKELINREANTDGASWNGKYASGNAFAGAGAIKKNNHPTVKPVELMQYLVRLVSPKGATILDIFNGSGSTGKAVAFENRERDANYKYIGIELDPYFCKISEMRIDYALNKYKYDLIEEIEENHKKGQMTIFDCIDGLDLEDKE